MDPGLVAGAAVGAASYLASKIVPPLAAKAKRKRVAKQNTAAAERKRLAAWKRKAKAEFREANNPKKPKRASRGPIIRKEGLAAPQIMVLSTPFQSVVSSYITVTRPTLAGASGANFFVMEVFWIDFYYGYGDVGNGSATHSIGVATKEVHADGDVPSVFQNVFDAAERNNIAVLTDTKHSTLEAISVGTPPTSDAFRIRTNFTIRMPIRVNLTDNNGHGILVASPKLQLWGSSDGDALVGQFVARICHRMKPVSATDFYRIKQSL